MTKAQRRLVNEGHKALLSPKFDDMTQEDRLLRVAMMAYAVISNPNHNHITDSELQDALYCEIANTVGDDNYIRWSKKISAECNQPDIDDD